MGSPMQSVWQPQLEIVDIAKLFAWFRANYGAQWVHDETELKVWHADLGGLTQADLRRGCETVRKSDGQYPPSLPAFRRMCKGSRIPYHYPPALPNPNTSVVLSKMVRDRLKDIEQGKPKYKGYYTKPKFIRVKEEREKYEAELEAWKAAKAPPAAHLSDDETMQI